LSKFLVLSAGSMISHCSNGYRPNDLTASYNC